MRYAPTYVYTLPTDMSMEFTYQRDPTRRGTFYGNRVFVEMLHARGDALVAEYADRDPNRFLAVPLATPTTAHHAVTNAAPAPAMLPTVRQCCASARVTARSRPPSSSFR